MNNVSNFYDELDLKYPEIGIALDMIDRHNPGNVRFCIPVLTPNMDNTKMEKKTIRQNTRNLMNADKGLEVDNISMSNYTLISIPKELCVLDSSRDRYIEAGSKWIIVFVGGDVTKPRVVSRYTE